MASAQRRPDSPLRWVLLVILLVTPVIVVRALAARGPSPKEQLEPLRASLHDLRVQLESCRVDAAGDEGDFRTHSDAADSLAIRLKQLESLHVDGVPADSYPVYLDVFREYDDAVSGWDQKAEAAREAWEECRDLTENHNLLADSLRASLVEMGMWPDGETP